MIAPYFPPRRRVGSLRPFKFAMHLRDFGWEPTVVCLETAGEDLTDREQAHLEGIEIVELELPLDLDRTRGGASSSDQSRAGPRTSAGRSIGAALARLPAPVKFPFARLGATARAVADVADRSVPVDTWWPVLRYHQPRLESLMRGRRFDAVWSTGDPWSAHLLARHLAKGPGPVVSTLGRLWSGGAKPPATRQVPWMADFRDPWTLCAVRGDGKPWPTRLVEEQVERAIFSAADRVVFTANTATERYREHYVGLEPHVETIVNGFDAGFFGLDETQLDVREFTAWPRRADRRLQLLFFGRFRALSPARPVVAMLAQLRRIAPEVFAHVRVQSVGPLDHGDAAAAREAGVEEAFEVVDPVPYEAALERLGQADVLLVSSSAARDDMIPAKLWDYLPARRPVLSMAANPEVDEVLRRTGRGIHVGPEAALPAAELVRAAYLAKYRDADDPFASVASAASDSIRAYEARELCRKLAASLDDMVAAQS